jgi:hypothetical protein
MPCSSWCLPVAILKVHVKGHWALPGYLDEFQGNGIIRIGHHFFTGDLQKTNSDLITMMTGPHLPKYWIPVAWHCYTITLSPTSFLAMFDAQSFRDHFVLSQIAFLREQAQMRFMIQCLLPGFLLPWPPALLMYTSTLPEYMAEWEVLCTI